MSCWPTGTKEEIDDRSATPTTLLLKVVKDRVRASRRGPMARAGVQAAAIGNDIVMVDDAVDVLLAEALAGVAHNDDALSPREIVQTQPRRCTPAVVVPDARDLVHPRLGARHFYGVPELVKAAPRFAVALASVYPVLCARYDHGDDVTDADAPEEDRRDLEGRKGHGAAIALADGQRHRGRDQRRACCARLAC